MTAVSVIHARIDKDREQPRRCDHVRICVGWSLFVSVITFVIGANPGGANDGLPWSAAWILYLPSLLTVFNSIRDPSGRDRTLETTITHALLGLVALLFIIGAIIANPLVATIEGCRPGLAGEWLRSDIYCPNVFEYRWGPVGKIVPVAFGVILTSFVHMIVMALRAHLKAGR